MLHRLITGEQLTAYTGLQNVATLRIKFVFKFQQINCGIENCPMDFYIRHWNFSIVIVQQLIYWITLLAMAHGVSVT